MWDQTPISCASILPIESKWTLNQIQFYLSEFKNNGQSLPLISKNNHHQQSSIALIGSPCNGEKNTQNANWNLYFNNEIEEGTFSFTLGVPFKINHLNPLKQSAPLNQSDMFWTWQQGHKFLRIDLGKGTKDPKTYYQTGWQFHLGSTGCKAESILRSPKTPCRYPNQIHFSFDYQNQSSLVFNLKPLLAPILTNPEMSRTSCMSNMTSNTCRQLVSSLQLDEGVWQLK
ncbi:metallo-mystery pair system four-Cys motif protein [Parashewanella spongiae]|nr:MbnP family copper-binding protein [Parashewanella spongiae]MCL1079235.1 metallo-mystery pair system four-Cys motif protein [Parashewanella spongiae]